MDKHSLSVPPSSTDMVCSPRSIAKPFVLDVRWNAWGRYEVAVVVSLPLTDMFHVDQRIELIKFYMVELSSCISKCSHNASSLCLG